MGLTGRYRTAPYRPASWTSGTVEFGFAGRRDDIDQAQNLLDAAVRSQTWDQRVDASILGADLGFWGDLDWRVDRHFRLRFGVRADALYYDVNDKLGNFVPLTRPDDTFIVGFRRSAFGSAFGPRASAEVKPLRSTTVDSGNRLRRLSREFFIFSRCAGSLSGRKPGLPRREECARRRRSTQV